MLAILRLFGFVTAAALVLLVSTCGPRAQPFLRVQVDTDPLVVPSAGETFFTLRNSGDPNTVLRWQLRVENAPGNPEAGDWLVFSATEGEIETGDVVVVRVGLEPSLSLGRYEATVTVIAPNITPVSFGVVGTAE